MIEFPPQENNPTDIAVIKNFLTAEHINLFFKNIKDIEYQQATIFTEDSSKSNNHRESMVKWIPHKDPFLDLYYACRDFVNFHNSYRWKFEIKNSWEQFQYTEYNSNTKGHYDWHVDTGPSKGCYRKLSLVIQLSDPKEYEGGDLRVFDPVVSKENFPYKSVPKSKGAAVLFPSYIPHKVTPVTKGIRKSLVWWIGGVPFK